MSLAVATLVVKVATTARRSLIDMFSSFLIRDVLTKGRREIKFSLESPKRSLEEFKSQLCLPLLDFAWWVAFTSIYN